MAERRFPSDPKIHTIVVKFKSEQGNDVELSTVYEDSLREGSSVGTVIGFHGAPGSHHDFKYIRDKLDDMKIRFIGINYPGFGHTSRYPGQSHGNEERQNYTNALLNALEITGKVIYMGHSRGCENALQTAVDRKAHGLALVNPTGLRVHQGLRPTYRISFLDLLYTILPEWIGNYIVFKVFRGLGFRVKSAEEAVSSMKAAISLSYEDIIEHIDKSNEQSMKKLIVFSGNDNLVEEEIVMEKLEKHAFLKHFEIEDAVSEEEREKILAEFGENRRGASVLVKKDTHFQNKLQADLIAKSCKAIFDN
uniref:AB hydrolase-1 domain-containing protein n=1 Tax=Caenorhabditis japonica TaxID=281687 RepID=A0A8R1DST8_CAEJA